MSTNSEPVSGGGAISDEWVNAERHERYEGPPGTVWCFFCSQTWPCDAAVLIAALDASEARAEAAEAERNELREAVRLHMDLSNHHLAAKCPYCRGN